MDKNIVNLEEEKKKKKKIEEKKKKKKQYEKDKGRYFDYYDDIKVSSHKIVDW